MLVQGVPRVDGNVSLEVHNVEVMKRSCHIISFTWNPGNKCLVIGLYVYPLVQGKKKEAILFLSAADYLYIKLFSAHASRFAEGK